MAGRKPLPDHRRRKYLFSTRLNRDELHRYTRLNPELTPREGLLRLAEIGARVLDAKSRAERARRSS